MDWPIGDAVRRIVPKDLFATFSLYRRRCRRSSLAVEDKLWVFRRWIPHSDHHIHLKFRSDLILRRLMDHSSGSTSLPPKCRRRDSLLARCGSG